MPSDDAPQADDAPQDEATPARGRADAAASDPAAPGPATAAPRLPAHAHAVFRPSRVVLLTALFITVCATPLALTVPGLQALYLVPVAMVIWVLRRRTTVDQQRIAARTMRARYVVPWSELSAFRLTKSSHVCAVRENGTEIPLPSVRTRHLPMLAALSGGRVTDPREEPPGAPREESGSSTGDAADGPDAASTAETSETSPPETMT